MRTLPLLAWCCIAVSEKNAQSKWKVEFIGNVGRLYDTLPFNMVFDKSHDVKMCLFLSSYIIGPFVNIKSVCWLRCVYTRQLNNANRCKFTGTLSSDISSSISIITEHNFTPNAHRKTVLKPKKTTIHNCCQWWPRCERKHRPDLFESDILMHDCRMCQIARLVLPLWYRLVLYEKHFSAKLSDWRWKSKKKTNGKRSNFSFYLFLFNFRVDYVHNFAMLVNLYG